MGVTPAYTAAILFGVPRQDRAPKCLLSYQGSGIIEGKEGEMVKKRLVRILTVVFLVCFAMSNFVFAGAKFTEEAIKSNDITEVKKAIEEGADVNARLSSGFYPLGRTIAIGSSEMAKLLIDNGADIHERNKFGATNLMVAARAGKAEIARLLILKGADVNAKEDVAGGGRTALHYCALGYCKGKNKKDFFEIVKLLVDNGADIHTKSAIGGSPLLYAAACSFLEMAKLLIDKGADVNEKTERGGTTPLMVSVKSGICPPGGSLEMAELLIDKGADVNAKSKIGDTALRIAEHTGNSEMVTLLKQHGAK
jgi:ankyrin repeat protein